ncbi:MAG: hypothetical protein EBY96_01505 [Actinobacteria bacterium]|nr:hypothetical protein [Actinomycetota bacterium]
MAAGRGKITSANQLREAFQGFFVDRGHTLVPSASLIPHDPTVLFTVAGMVPFKPYFVGDEVAPYKRAVSVQKSARAGGKHNDLDDVGRTKRHLVFFEMMGNFSFGDYFKSDAIPWSWELVTEVFGFDGDRLWITVHESDDEAEAIWHEQVGVPMDRIQRLGDKDNFWQMGETGTATASVCACSLSTHDQQPCSSTTGCSRRMKIAGTCCVESSGVRCAMPICLGPRSSSCHRFRQRQSRSCRLHTPTSRPIATSSLVS